MARRQKDWAQRARRELLASLGGFCVDCNEHDLDLLVPDHIDARTRTWSTKGKDASWRLSLYREDARKGLLCVRCVACNDAKGNRYRQERVKSGREIVEESKIPF